MVNVNTNEATNVGTNSATLNGELTEFAVSMDTYQNSSSNDVDTITLPEGEYIVEVHGASGADGTTTSDDEIGSGGSGGYIKGEITVGSQGDTWDIYLAEAGSGSSGGTGYDDGGDGASQNDCIAGGGGGETVIWSQGVSEEIALAGGGGGGSSTWIDAFGYTYASGGGGAGSGGNAGSAGGADYNSDGSAGGGAGTSGGKGGDAEYPTVYNGADGNGSDLNNGHLSNITTTQGGSNYSAGTVIIREKIDTVVNFDWGTSSGSLNNKTTDQTITTDTSLPASFSETLTGLDDGTTYYFRASADSGTGDNGSELSFTTIKILLLDDDLFFSEYNSVDEYYLYVITKYADNIDSDSARLVGELQR